MADEEGFPPSPCSSPWSSATSGMGSFASRAAALVLAQVITIPFVRRPFQDLERPEAAYGMRRADNLRIPVGTDGKQTLGAWLMLPLTDEEEGETSKEEAPRPQTGGGDASTAESEGREQVPLPRLTGDDTLVIYAHGNAETRSQHHRRELYKIYQRLGYHVLAFDYRGYGDSSYAFPDEDTMAEDAIAAFRFATDGLSASSSSSASLPKVVVHGHSLGTAVTARMAANLKEEERRPSAYILESPFNRMRDEVRTFGIARVANRVLDLDKLLKDAKMEFDSQRWIQSITEEPILILHAKDDNTIPYELAHELYEASRRVASRVELVTYPAELGLGHNNIFLHPDLPRLLEEFVGQI